MLALRLLSEGGEGPNTELLWLMYAGMAFFFLVIAVGWWSNSKKQNQPAVQVETVEHEKKETDDLVKIEGIGPKVAKTLNEMGISTFDDLARAKSAEVQKALNGAGLQMMNPEGWIEQAKAAAKGDWKTFEKLQKELKVGRRK
ncbi:MAG: helix-hairpin-helix domain-containing protein [Anaerolineales bacterium]|nr:helix-hairpin-helix domain-containing protein [Anaerolineales bacterium]